MTNQQLFQAALGLAEPWCVERSDFDPAAHRLDLYLGFARGARFPCPEGDQAACPVHDTIDKSWRHLDFFQHQAYLHARVPRIGCPAHGVRMVAVPWARPESGFTLLFEALIMAMAPEMPVKAIGELVGEHDTRLWRVIHHYVDRARERLDLAGVRSVGVDETSSRRGHDYITVFMDLDQRRVLYATEGKDATTVGAFVKDLEAHGGAAGNIEEVCSDLSAAYALGVVTYLPDAEVTYDRYHLCQLLSLAVDTVRREETPALPKLLKGTRFLFLKNPRSLTAKQSERLDYLLEREYAIRTARAYRWRLQFDAFFEQPPHLAAAYLDNWCRGAMRSRLHPIKTFAKTVRQHREGILRWHTSRINNGILEATNSLIQAAKRRARGYRTSANLIAMVYLIAGKLDLAIPHSI